MNKVYKPFCSTFTLLTLQKIVRLYLHREEGRGNVLIEKCESEHDANLHIPPLSSHKVFLVVNLTILKSNDQHQRRTSPQLFFSKLLDSTFLFHRLLIQRPSSPKCLHPRTPSSTSHIYSHTSLYAHAFLCSTLYRSSCMV